MANSEKPKIYLIVVVSLTVLLSYGHIYLASKIMEYTFQVTVEGYGILGVAIVIAISLGASIWSVGYFRKIKGAS